MNDPSLSVMILDGSVTPGLRSLILMEIVAYLSIKDYNDSSLAWQRLIRVVNVVW